MNKNKLDFILAWFKIKKWDPLLFQIEAWNLIFEKKSGLISVPTGAGKTYAAYLAALANLHFHHTKGIQILYITPLRALAYDLQKALSQPIIDLNLPYRVETRTGDTTASERKKQLKNPPDILLITPESLALLLSYDDAFERFQYLQTVIVDEWHELLGNKRGVLLELCLSRLKKWSPTLIIWGLSATLANLEQAAKVCVGVDRELFLVRNEMKRELILETLLPPSIDQIPWAGQLGLRLLPFLLEKLSLKHTTLIFTNTRSQAERWYQAFLEAKPEWKNWLGLHHSSISKAEREKIESQLKEGELKIVFCTSSLDLGVDFSPVERVIQIGSPKSIARLMQRAGRASHRPLTPCHLCIVPTHALEIAEIKAFRMALEEHIIEKRIPLINCFDVLLQHMMSCAIGGNFTKEDLLHQIRSTYAFHKISDHDFDQCLNFLISGGNALGAYPEYKKLLNDEGRYYVADKRLKQIHRMNIGTIPSDPQIPLKLAKSKVIGFIEENFISTLKPGDRFLFGGRNLELIQFHDLTAYVRLSTAIPKHAAVWNGGRIPYSVSLGEMLRRSLVSNFSQFVENTFLEEIFSIQRRLSAIPEINELLIEKFKSAQGWHLCIYPFEGRLVHQGLAYLISSRLSRIQSATFKISVNDYGFELLSHDPINDLWLTPNLFSPSDLENEITTLINMHELGKSHFRDIARISGLIFQGFPHKHKSHRQLHIGSSVLYDVFVKYDPQNLLLKQAKHEVLQQHFEIERLSSVLQRLSKGTLLLKILKKLSPFALPLFVERMSGHLTTETLAERIEKITNSWTRR